MPGYENNPKANGEAFTDGWFRTGDQGVMDAQGYISITGRLKEIINRGGGKISPREGDEVMMDRPAGQQCGTLPVPHYKVGGGGRSRRSWSSATDRRRPTSSCASSSASGSPISRCPRRSCFERRYPRARRESCNGSGSRKSSGSDEGFPYGEGRRWSDRPLAA